MALLTTTAMDNAAASLAACCAGCHLLLKDPFIECGDCKAPVAHICLDCFSRGKEFGAHRSFHSYKVVKKDFCVLDDDWTAEEELLFLNALVQRGLGNWEDIARVLLNKNARQCEQHFESVYVENESGHLLDSWKKEKEEKKTNDGGQKIFFRRRRDQPVNFHAPLDLAGEGPPRPANNSQTYKDLGGYNAARGDFDHEMGSLAEREIDAVDFDAIRLAVRERNSGVVAATEQKAAGGSADLACGGDGGDEEDEKLDRHLQLAAVEVYMNKLKARTRVKRVVREMGLINKSKVVAKTNLYHTLLLRSGPGYSQLLKYGRLMCSFDFDFLLEGMQHEMELRQQIMHLQEYRQNGLCKFLSTAFYSKLKQQREKNFREVSNDSVMDWTQSRSRSGGGGVAVAAVSYVQDKVTGRIIPTTNRRSSLPLDIIGMPGYEKLTGEERELCSEIRVYPEMFLEIRQLMVAECVKNKGLRLADARPVVKIDVNKTRKLYDYFIARGDVYKPSS